MEDVIKPLGLTITDAAKNAWCKPESIIREFVNEKAMLSPDMAIRIAKRRTHHDWMNMQRSDTLESRTASSKECYPISSVRSEEAAALPDVKMAPSY